MKRNILIICVLTTKIAFAQLGFNTKIDTSKFLKVYEIADQRKISRMFCVINDATYELERSSGKDFLIKNGIKVDSTYDFLYKFEFDANQAFPFCKSLNDSSNVYWKVNFDKDRFERIANTDLVILGEFNENFIIGAQQESHSYDVVPYISKIAFTNNLNSMPFRQIDFKNYLAEDSGIIWAISSNQPRNEIIFASAHCYPDGCDDYKYFALSYNTNHVVEIKVTSRLEKAIKDQDENHIYFFNGDYSKYYLCTDFSFTHLDTLLIRNSEILGIIREKNIALGYTQKSILDRKAFKWSTSTVKVVINIKAKLSLEKVLYKFFNDVRISESDIIDFDLYDLLISENLIFAKHNYKFDSEYYQAFFNLFPWYNSVEKRQTRIKEVNDLLTKADKENLKIINNELKRFRK